LKQTASLQTSFGGVNGLVLQLTRNVTERPTQVSQEKKGPIAFKVPTTSLGTRQRIGVKNAKEKGRRDHQSKNNNKEGEEKLIG